MTGSIARSSGTVHCIVKAVTSYSICYYGYANTFFLVTYQHDRYRHFVRKRACNKNVDMNIVVILTGVQFNFPGLMYQRRN